RTVFGWHRHQFCVRRFLSKNASLYYGEHDHGDVAQSCERHDGSVFTGTCGIYGGWGFFFGPFFFDFGGGRRAPPGGFLALPFFFCTAVLGGIAAAAAGWIVGLPSLRLRGDYLAIVTLGFGEIIRVVLLNTAAVGGARGMYGIKGPSDWNLGFVTLSQFLLNY